MFTVGLDVHARSIRGAILNADGKRIKEFESGGLSDWGRLRAEIGRLDGPVQVCFEASCGYGQLHDGLVKLPNVQRVVVAHPGQVRLIFCSKQKNDRVDARRLATLLYLNQAPAVHVPPLDVRSWRGLIEFRNQLVQRQTRAKNQMRALLRTYGELGPHRKALWTRKGLAWLAAVELPTPLALLQRSSLLDELAHCRCQILEVERALNQIGATHPGVQLLRTIPGVGPRTAEAMIAYIDDAKRFSRGKQVSSYFGLVPCQDQSGGVNRLGHITRNGPSTVRRLLTEATWQGVQRSPEIRARFERVRRGDPRRKKIALVATANWLAKVMLTMLRTGEVARFTRQTAAEARKQAALVGAPPHAA